MALILVWCEAERLKKVKECSHKCVALCLIFIREQESKLCLDDE